MKRFFLLIGLFIAAHSGHCQSPNELLSSGFYQFQQNDLQAAATLFKKVIASCTPQNATASVLINGYLYLGIAEYEMKHYQEALTPLDSARTLGGKEFIRAYNYLGMCYVELVNYPKAISVLDEAVALEQTDQQAFYWRGIAKMRSLGNRAGCDDLRQAQALGNPDVQQLIDTNCK